MALDRRGTVVVVGGMNMDLLLRVPRWPEQGETVIDGSYRALPGGRGANQAVAAARQGAQVRMVGCVGQDPLGQALLTSLRLADVEVEGVRQANSATGLALLAEKPDEERRVIVVPGANRAVTARHVEDERALFEGADLLLLQFEIPLEAMLAAARVAREAGAKVILTPAPPPAAGLPADLLALVDILVPNEQEARELSREPTVEGAGGRLRGMGVESVIVTLGPRGALLVDGRGAREIAPFEVEAVDGMAARDAFVGGLAAALARGRPIDEAARWGAAAGALAVTRQGAQRSLPAREAVESLLATAEGRPPTGYPEEMVQSIRLHNGQELLIRPILPTDAPRLQSLFATLSPESIYRRFFMQKRQVDDNEARRLATVDYAQSHALVASLADSPERVIGVARYAPAGERQGAVEMAIVVSDEYQHIGIGRHLFNNILAAARMAGHRWMLVETQSDNQPMIELAEQAGYPSRNEREGALVRIWLELQP